jgi:hypothetical protein
MIKKSKSKVPAEVVESPEARGAQMALQPSVNAAAVIQSFTGAMFGKEPDINVLIDGLRGSFKTVKDGDLSSLEAMLVGQATALQSLFTSLARRAQSQQSQRHLEAFLGLALKAQAQSRATIQAVVELKYPRQVAFVKQANISHGPQQVNNGIGRATDPRTHAEENGLQQNKLLEDQRNGRTYLDTGATRTPSRGDPALETVDAVNGTKSVRGKAKVSGNAYTGSHWANLRQAIKALNQALREQKDLLH